MNYGDVIVKVAMTCGHYDFQFINDWKLYQNTPLQQVAIT